jgi:spore coat polysaccharide biosynthesis protein SpsF
MAKKPRVGAIIQARMSSTRLPGKVMKLVNDRPLISYVYERVNNSALIDKVVIATTEGQADNALVSYCNQFNIACFRGPEDDVLNRYLQAAKYHGFDVVVRVCGDSPLIDSKIIDNFVDEFLRKYPKCDYLTNTLEQTYPLGMNVEVINFAALEYADNHSTSFSEREHVTPYLHQNSAKFNITKKNLVESYGEIRVTVDVEEDFLLVKKILETLYSVNKYFTCEDLIKFYKKNKALFRINSEVEQKKWHDE